MGITSTDIDLIRIALDRKPDIKTVCELGSQNLYLEYHEKPPFASSWYEEKGLIYHCIDMAGDNEAIQIDLSKDIEIKDDTTITQDITTIEFKKIKIPFDLVTDFGTSEHVVKAKETFSHAFHEGHINSIYPTEGTITGIIEGFYECWKNKHNLLKEGGLMINVNPKTGHWPNHGYTYVDLDFYKELAKQMNYEVILLHELAAMGNIESGMNIVCILKKNTARPFLSFKDFQKIKTYPK